MAGEPNHDHFRDARERLRQAGHEVICPDEEASRRFSPEEIHAHRAMGEAFRETQLYAEIMRHDIQLVMTCDAVCTLTGWQQSRGATAEVAVAKALGLTVGSIDEFIGENAPPLLKWVSVIEGSCPPTRKYDGDAGFDLYVAQSCQVHVGGFLDVPCGIAVELPVGMWAMVTGRSSTIRDRGLLVTQGIIDNGFRGELFAGVQNVSGKKAIIEKGERIAQLIPFHQGSLGMQVAGVVALSSSDRGTNGFGSTGA